jgi:hypothetical protein
MLVLCVARRELISRDLDQGLWPTEGNALLIAPTEGFESAAWEVHGRDGMSTLRDLWKDLLLPPPAVNRLFLIWESADSYLCELVQSIYRQRTEFRVSISLLLVGPVAADPALETILSLSAEPDGDRFVSTVWYVGNEDHARHPIPVERRQALASAFLALLLAGDEKLVTVLRLYPPNQSLPPFTAFGLRSWVPPADIAEDVVRYASAFLIRSQLADAEKAASRSTGETACRNEAASLFGKLRVLDTPYAKESDSPPVPYPERLSPPPSNPFLGWISSLLRERAVTDGTRRILHQRVSTTSYFHRLKEELQELGREIRHNGQRVFEATRTSCRDFLGRNSTIPQMVTLLHAYFPVMRSMAIADRRAPCEPASVPSTVECDEWFVRGAVAELSKSCGKLPTTKQALIVATICLLLIIASGILFHKGYDWQTSLSPFLLAVLVAGAFVAWASFWAKRAMASMVLYFDKHYDRLRRIQRRRPFAEELHRPVR